MEVHGRDFTILLSNMNALHLQLACISPCMGNTSATESPRPKKASFYLKIMHLSGYSDRIAEICYYRKTLVFVLYQLRGFHMTSVAADPGLQYAIM